MNRLFNIATVGLLVIWGCSRDDSMSDAPTTVAAVDTAVPTGQASAPPAKAAAPSVTTIPTAAAGTFATKPSAHSSPAASGGAAAATAGAPSAAASAAGAPSAAASAAGAPATAGMPQGTTRSALTGIMMPTVMETPKVAPWFNVWRPKDLQSLELPAPLVVWNNGGCFRSDGTWRVLFERWAGAGFVVLSLTDGGGGDQTTVEDHGALIDWAEAQNGMAGGPFEGKLDLTKIAAAGNSCGGITSLGLAAQDDRVKAIFVLSGSSGFGGADQAVISKITIPVAYIEGSDEDISRANADADFAALADGLPAMIVARSTGDHVTISADATVMKHASEISTNWFDLVFFGKKVALDALQTPTVCTGCDPGLWTLMARNLDTLVK